MIKSFSTWLLFAALFVIPWLIGGTYPFARFGLAICAMVLVTLSLVTSFQRGSAGRQFHWIWVLLLLGIGYLSFQTIDPTTLFSSLPEKPIPSLTTASTHAVSIYPAATQAKLVDLIIAVGLFFATTLMIRRSDQITSLMVAMLVTGALVSFFGILQAVSWNGELFWQYEMTQRGLAFGPFVNRNNAAGFLLVSLCSGIYLLIVELVKWRADAETSASQSDVQSRKRSKKRSLLTPLIYLLAKIETRHLYIGLGLIVVLAGIIMTLSKGGVLATLIVLGSLAAITGLKKQLRVPVLVLLVVIGLASAWFVSSAGFDEKLGERINQVTELKLDEVPRLKHWNDMLPLVHETTLGTGAGTYRYVSPRYQSFEFDKVFAHAENVYLETFVELGYPGLTLLVLVLVFALVACFRLLRSERSSENGLGLFGLLTLIGVGTASFFDFGIYQPANFTIVAVAMALVVSRSAIVGSSVAQASSAEDSTRGGGVFAGAGMSLAGLALMTSLAWSIWFSFGYESLRSVARQIALSKTHMNSSDPLISNSALVSMSNRLDRAEQICAGNAEVRFQMGELFLLEFQKRKSKELEKSVNSELERRMSLEEKRFWESYTPEKVWASSSLQSVNREAFKAKNSDAESDSETPVADSTLERKYLDPAMEHFQAASELRRGDWLTHLRLAQLEPVVNQPSENATKRIVEHLEIVMDRPYPSAQMLFDSGLIYLNAGVTDKAVELWSQCLRKTNARRYERPIVELSMSDLPMQPFFERVLPQVPDVMLRVARNYFRDPQLILPKRLLLMHTDRVIQSRQEELDAADFHFYLAESARLSDRYEEAAAQFQLALQQRPTEVVWRFEYARCLNELRQYSEAIRQLQKCQLEKSPIFPRIKPLMERVRSNQRIEAQQAMESP